MRMPRNLIVIGACAADVAALKRLVAALPADLDAAICVALHKFVGDADCLDQVLRAGSSLPVVRATDGQVLRKGEVLVECTERRFLIEEARVRLTPRSNEDQTLANVDGLFRTAAKSFGRRTIGVVLAGLLQDCSAALRSIRDAGGRTIVQLPSAPEFDIRPESAIRQTLIDQTLRLREIPAVLARLVNDHQPAGRRDSTALNGTQRIKRRRVAYRCLP